MDRLMESEFGKRFDYNELIMDNEWWARLTTSEANNGIQKLIFIKKNEVNILRVYKNNK